MGREAETSTSIEQSGFLSVTKYRKINLYVVYPHFKKNDIGVIKLYVNLVQKKSQDFISFQDFIAKKSQDLSQVTTKIPRFIPRLFLKNKNPKKIPDEQKNPKILGKNPNIGNTEISAFW